MDLGFAIREVAIGGAYALAISTRHQAHLIHLTDPVSAAVLPIAGKPEAVYFSPLGTAAAILTAEGSLVFVTGIGDGSPRVDQFQIGSRVSALAVTDDGAFVLTALADAPELMLVGRDGSQVSIPAPGSVSALAFRPSGYDALAAGRDNLVWMVQPTIPNSNFVQLADKDDGIAGPVALGFGADGKRAVITNSGNSTVAIVDLQTGSKWSVPCSCRPTRLERLTVPGFFRINELSEQPLFLVDTVSQRVLFVPPVFSNQPRSARAQ